MVYFSSYRNLYQDIDQISLGTDSVGTNAIGSWVDLAIFRNGSFNIDAIQIRSAKGTDGVLLPFISSDTAGTTFFSMRVIDEVGNLVTTLMTTQAFAGSVATLGLTELDTSRFIMPGSKYQVKLTGTNFSSGKLFIRTLFKSLDTNPTINLVAGTAYG